MKARINFYGLAGDITQQASKLQQAIVQTGIETSLFELIKIRASQINGCAYCLNMHNLEARQHGETEQRLYVLAAWRESSLFTPRERAALAWTEAVTLVSTHGAAEAQFAELKQHFTEAEIAAVTSQIAMINFWNRVAISGGFIHPSEEKARTAKAQPVPT